jgi:uncharacterized protein (TIGR02646 family)
MIAIKRSPSPSILKEPEPDKDLYNRKEVVDTLWAMQHGKCCYCENLIPQKGHLKAVEHFRPKSIFKYLTNQWENLLLSCAQCNGKKKDRFPVVSDRSGNFEIVYASEPTDETPALVDPSLIDPEDHIDFDFSSLESEDGFGIVMEKGGSLIGKTTIEILGLAGSFHAKKRYNFFLDAICANYLNLLRAKNQENQAALEASKQAFRNLMSAKSEFAAFARAFARQKKLDLPPFELRIPVGWEIYIGAWPPSFR